MAARRAARFEIKAPLEFTLWDPKINFFGFATDISVRGAFVATAFPAAPDSDVVLRMWPEGWGEEVLLASVVRWRGSTGMGVQFLSVGPRQARAIRDLIAEWQSHADGGAARSSAPLFAPPTKLTAGGR